MRKILLALGIAALAAGLPPGASGLEVALRFEKNLDLTPSLSGPFFPFGFGRTELTQTAPSGTKLPTFFSEKPFYGSLRLGGRDYAVALDGKRAGDKSYSRFWIDRDGDGDLSDEVPVDGKMQSQGGNSFGCDFPGIELTIGSEKIRLPYCIKPEVYGYSSGRQTQAILSYVVPCAYTGTFTLGGKTCTVWLSDRDGNGMFNDRMKVQTIEDAFSRQTVRPEGDVIFLSDGRAPDLIQYMALGDLLVIQNRVFEFGINIPGGKLTLTEVKKGLVPVRLSMKPERIVLYGVNGGKSVMIHAPAGDTVPLPAGSYRLLSYQVFRKDEQGDLWRLTAGGTNESPVIEVKPGGSPAIVFGEPFLAAAEKPGGEMARTQRNSIQLLFHVEGQGGELLMDLSHLEGNATAIPLSKSRKDRPREPSYTIVKGDGEIVARGSFEYG